mgnify:CR=1 FL=1
MRAAFASERYKMPDNLYKPCSTMTVELIAYIQNHPGTVLHMDQFLCRYQNSIFNFIRITIGDYHDAMELTNRVLLTLSHKVKEIEIKRAFNSMAVKVIKGEISNYWKGLKTEKAQMVRQTKIWHYDEEISLFDALESKEAKAAEIFELLTIRDIIENSGDDNMKNVFLLKYRDEESVENIADRLNLTKYQVKKYISAIALKVKKYLEEA